MSTPTYHPVDAPQPGDWADHKSGLDPRRVTAVSEDGEHIWLHIITTDVGPLPADNYTFTREEW